MKNKFVSALATLAVVAASFTPVMAEWHPSKGQSGVEIPDSSTTIKVGDTDVAVTTNRNYSEGPAIIVTPESNPVDPYTTTVYNKALQYSGKSVDAFLAEYGVQAAVNEELKNKVGSSAKSADLDMLAMFDVTANQAALDLINTAGSATFTVSVSGVKASGTYIAVHFKDDGSAEVIPCTAGDGTVTLTMSSFSPVMILSYKEGSSTKPATAGKTANTSDNNNVMLYAGIMGVAIVAAGVVFFSTRKKKGQD